jgi:hypothetical protein
MLPCSTLPRESRPQRTPIRSNSPCWGPTCIATNRRVTAAGRQQMARLDIATPATATVVGLGVHVARTVDVEARILLTTHAQEDSGHAPVHLATAWPKEKPCLCIWCSLPRGQACDTRRGVESRRRQAMSSECTCQCGGVHAHPIHLVARPKGRQHLELRRPCSENHVRSPLLSDRTADERSPKASSNLPAEVLARAAHHIQARHRAAEVRDN